jgi:hypothetical protein
MDGEYQRMNGECQRIDKKDNEDKSEILGDKQGKYKYFYTKYDIEVDLHKHYVDELLLKSPKT